MIYLASPYSHDDPAVRRRRFQLACRAAGRLMQEGRVVYSPIAHTHSIAEMCDLPKGWDYWERFDRTLLEAASSLYVLRLDGWRASIGVQAEIQMAQDLGLDVTYIDPQPQPA